MTERGREMLFFITYETEVTEMMEMTEVIEITEVKNYIINKDFVSLE